MRQKPDNKRALLTGVAGFVGSNLADRLIAEGWEVVGVDNFLTGRPENIAHLKREPRFHFVEAAVESMPEISARFDWVMHFASPASPPKYQASPIDCMRCNAEGTHKLLELCEQQRAQFFLASTSEIYGDPLRHPQVESYWGNVNPIGPRSMYDESKRYAEAMSAAFRRSRNVKTRVIRIFNTYGPRMSPDDGRVVSNFICQALSGRSLTIYGDGSQTRSFQFIEDLLEGIIRLMQVDYQEPINLGNPQEFSVLELAERIKQAVDRRDIRIVFYPLPGDDPTRRRPDISRARELLNWAPQVGLCEGLERTIPYFRGQLNRRRASKLVELGALSAQKSRPTGPSISAD